MRSRLLAYSSVISIESSSCLICGNKTGISFSMMFKSCFGLIVQYPGPETCLKPQFFSHKSIFYLGLLILMQKEEGQSASILILFPKLEECAPIHCPIVPEVLGTFDRWLWLYFLVITGMFPRTYGHVYPQRRANICDASLDFSCGLTILVDHFLSYL